MYTHGVSFLDLIDPTRAGTALASVKHCIVTGLPGHPENEVHAMKRQTKRPQDELEAPVKDHRQFHEVGQRQRHCVGHQATGMGSRVGGDAAVAR